MIWQSLLYLFFTYTHAYIPPVRHDKCPLSHTFTYRENIFIEQRWATVSSIEVKWTIPTSLGRPDSYPHLPRDSVLHFAVVEKIKFQISLADRESIMKCPLEIIIQIYGRGRMPSYLLGMYHVLPVNLCTWLTPTKSSIKDWWPDTDIPITPTVPGIIFLPRRLSCDVADEYPPSSDPLFILVLHTNSCTDEHCAFNPS